MGAQHDGWVPIGITMRRDALWDEFTRQNPRLRSGSATMPLGGVRKLFRLTWDHAYQTGVADEKARLKRDDPFSSFMDTLSKGKS